jgi:hypothetical protein
MINYPNEEPWLPCTDDYFYVNKKNNSDGLHPMCKKCSIKRTKNNRAENFDFRKNYDKKRYKINPQKFKDNVKKNKEIKPEHYKVLSKLWWKKNKEKVASYGKNRRKYKKHIINAKEWSDCKNYFNNCCAYCGLPIEQHITERSGKLINIDLHKEHVIDGGKNDLSNCIPGCLTCNTSKHTKTLNQFYNPGNSNYTYERYHKIYMWIRYDYKKYIMPKRKYKNQHIKILLKEIENKKIII